jgi:hypothetical protein
LPPYLGLVLLPLSGGRPPQTALHTLQKPEARGRRHPPLIGPESGVLGFALLKKPKGRSPNLLGRRRRLALMRISVGYGYARLVLGVSGPDPPLNSAGAGGRLSEIRSQLFSPTLVGFGSEGSILDPKPKRLSLCK